MIGIQDAKERGYDWVCQEFNRLLEDLDRDAGYFNVIRIAKEQMEQEEERAAVQEQKLAEVDEMEFVAEIDGVEIKLDFDKDFGTVGVNELVRMLIKSERTKNFAEFNQELGRVQTEAAEKISGYEEREVILQRNNAELQAQTKEDERTMETMYNEAKGLREQIERLSADNAALKTENHDLKLRNEEIDQNRTNAARIILERDQEIERLENQIDEMRRSQLMGERVAQRPIIDVTPNLMQAYEAAKQATAAKRQVMITGNIGANFKEIQNPDGTKGIIHESMIGRDVEVVTEFPTLPEIVFEQESIGTQYDVEESPVVFGGSEASSAGDLVEEVREAAFTETVEVAQETAYSEEVGKEWYYTPIGMRLHETFEEWVTRSINELKSAMHDVRTAA